MTAEEKEYFRWQFAAQLGAGVLADNSDLTEDYLAIFAQSVVKTVDALIAELEKSAPKGCEQHDLKMLWVLGFPSFVKVCSKCGASP